MSSITISSLERITAAKLAETLLAASAASAESATGTGVATASATEAETEKVRKEGDSGSGLGSIAVVDVRDGDHVGGHIRSSLHFPSASLDATMPTLVRKLADKDTVVFHCALSQQRGPGAALKYLREREAAAAGNGEGAKKEQKVFVLDRGFVGWQEVFGSDERLTEGYRKELWEDY
ncbi:Rhodanese-like protein [Xylariaceae sp. FL0594]|nr:Rhodanese-like protein [Xylariaceae sp. FL0594]